MSNAPEITVLIQSATCRVVTVRNSAMSMSPISVTTCNVSRMIKSDCRVPRWRELLENRTHATSEEIAVYGIEA